MKTFVFCGQGSQFVGMGKEFFGEFPTLVREADEILGYSIEELCLADCEKKLNLTQYTQPALYVVSMLEYYSRIKNEPEPDYVIGHSAGEYAALCAAGAFSFQDGLKIIKERGRLMAEQQGGGMAAIIGLNQGQVEHVIEKYNLSIIDIANLNTEKQIVISGPLEDVKACECIFLDEGASSFIVLKVSGAFHSRYMEKAQERMNQYISGIPINEIKIPVISNYTARPYEKGKIKNTLIPQMSNSVKWVESVRYLMSFDNMEFVKIGPGNNTINLVNRILKEVLPLTEIEKEKTIFVAFDETKEEVNASESPEIKNNPKFMFSAYKEEPNMLGSREFRQRYHTKYSYIVGGMGMGISGADLVANACNNGILSFIGTEGLERNRIVELIDQTKRMIGNDTLFGVNITQDYFDQDKSSMLLDLCLENNVKAIEISNFMSVTKELVKYKVSGMRVNESGQYEGNSIVAKISQTPLASEFMRPAPEDILCQLLDENEISLSEYELAKKVPIVDDLCLLGDCAFETERGNMITMLAEVLSVREKIVQGEGRSWLFSPRVGCAGGIGAPRIAVLYFYMGADFILTGSINQCTKDADLPDTVKKLLEQVAACDFTYVPSEKFFELNKSVQVVKKGVFFPSRANLLKSLYDVNDSIDTINENMRTYIKNKLFHMELEDYFQIMKKELNEKQVKLAQTNPKYKMALIFKNYLKKAFNSTMAAMNDDVNLVDCEIYCSSALGVFNELVKETELEKWNNRNVANIAEFIMLSAQEIVTTNK